MSKTPSERELDVALARRETLFRRIQLCFDVAKEAQKEPNDKKKLENFQIRYNQISKTVEEYKQLIHQIVVLKQKIEPEVAPSFQLLETFEDIVDHIEYLALQLIPPVSSSNNSANDQANSNDSIHRINMPKIELMVFDGEDLSLWPLFYENFKQFVHVKPEFNTAEKLQYLLSSLTGKALQTCSSIEPLPANYGIIWKLLEDTYQDKKYLANLYLDRLYNFRLNNSSNQSHLKIFLEEFHTTVVALKRLQIENLEDYILTHLAMTKLPMQGVNSFELIRIGTDLPKYEEVIHFVRKRSRVIKPDKSRTGFGNANSVSSSFKNSKSFLVSHPKSNSTENSSTNRNRCIICDGNTSHVVNQCSKFLKLDPNERFKLVKDIGLYINCLNTNHKLINCKSKHSCSHCSSKHHSLLHFNTPSTSQPLQPIANTSKDDQNLCNSSVIHTLCSSEDHSKHVTVLLSTAVVYAFDNNNQKQKIRVLLDTGSQSNFISYRCIKRLGLSIGRTDLSVYGIGSSTKLVDGYSRLTFVSQFNDQQKYSIDVFVIDEITNRLPSAFFDTSKLMHLNHLPLANDSYHIPGEIDGIIGASLLGRILRHNKLIGCPEMPVAIETTLGYVIMGQAPILETPLNQKESSAISETRMISLVGDFSH